MIVFLFFFNHHRMSTKTRKKKPVASKCIKCCFQQVEKKQHDIELSIAVGRIAQLEAEVQRLLLRIPVKKEIGVVACQTDDDPSFLLQVASNDTGCQTEWEEEFFTDTGTLIDGDEEDYQRWLLSKDVVDEEDKTCVEEEVAVEWYPTDDGDVLFCVENLYPHFSVTSTCDDMYVEDGILSLQRLLKVCEDLPFPYDEDEIRQQGLSWMLFYFLEARVPFHRTLRVHQTYAWYDDRVGHPKEWCVERRYHFHFVKKGVFSEEEDISIL